MRKLPHETIEHEMAIKLARKVATSRWPPSYAGLARQASRAANSVVLNLAEARWKSGASARASIRIALGELGEVASAMQLGRIRCWRQYVEPLYERLLPLAECEAAAPAPPAACEFVPRGKSKVGSSAPSPASVPSTPPRPSASRRSEEPGFPEEGSPWTHRFDSPDGLPRNMKDWEMLRRWMAAQEERIYTGEFDEELCDDQA